jgi:glutathione S-transferase
MCEMPINTMVAIAGTAFTTCGCVCTVADVVAAYTFDVAAVLEKRVLLDNLPRLRGLMERMYKRPNAPSRIAEAFASLRR